MKKITFLLITLLFTMISYSQVIVDEAFTSATIPANWYTYEIGNGSAVWGFGSPDMPTGNNFTSNAAIYDDDAAGNTGLHDKPILYYGGPSNSGFDASAYSNLILSYDYALQVNGATGDQVLNILLWDNSTSDWITIRTYDTDTDPTNDSINISDNIASNAGVDPANLFFGFGFDDIDGGFDWGAGIDNVRLVAQTTNDFCVDAIAVPVNAAGTGCTSPTIANNLGATDSSPFNGTPTCASFGGGDIWFTFTAPATGDVKIIVPEVGEWSSFGTALYVGGTCADTPELGCEVNFDINSAANVPSEVTYTGLTPGDSYVLRAWDFGNDNFGVVSFCIEEFDSTASVNDDIIDGLTLHPNPVNDLLSIDSQEEISKVTVFNLLGQEVISINPVSNNFNLDLSNLDSGIYIVKLISTKNKESTRKIVKK